MIELLRFTASEMVVGTDRKGSKRPYARRDDVIFDAVMTIGGEKWAVDFADSRAQTDFAKRKWGIGPAVDMREYSDSDRIRCIDRVFTVFRELSQFEGREVNIP